MEAINSTVCDAVRSHLGACDSAAAMGGAASWAALVVAVCVLCGESEASVADIRQAYYENELASDYYLQVGRSFNLLPRFGFLTLSIKVFPQHDNNDWLFQERTVEVFRKNSYWTVQSRGRPDAPPTQSRAYDPDFIIDFCDNARDLLTAYFDNFYIEGVPEPHRVFTSSISTKMTAQHLGIHPTYLSSVYSFVLVRLVRRNKRATLDGQLALTSGFKRAARHIRVGSSESVNQFLDQYGTHVITQYEVGDILYQVYVFGNRTYWDFKRNFALSRSSENELRRMERYFTPSHALHVGRVKLASGNPQFQEVMRELRGLSFFRTYYSIFHIFKIPQLEEKLEQLEGEAVIGLKLEKITKIVPKSPERHWLGEILDNTLSLFYVTM
ncbi:Torso-like protein [Chionoecetes opilio]|uniref:Torso-like protein n=1 Tax=Chionoecetes opilio TaxID=41210 RepID=A0A8J5CJ08_CHIOP|nr:Torso-like protein [Chionoecetes opilio]